MKIEISQKEREQLAKIAKEYKANKGKNNENDLESLRAAYKNTGITLECPDDFVKSDEKPKACVPCAACFGPPDPPVYAIAFGYLA